MVCQSQTSLDELQKVINTPMPAVRVLRCGGGNNVEGQGGKTNNDNNYTNDKKTATTKTAVMATPFKIVLQTVAL